MINCLIVVSMWFSMRFGFSSEARVHVEDLPGCIFDKIYAEKQRVLESFGRGLENGISIGPSRDVEFCMGQRQSQACFPPTHILRVTSTPKF